MYERLKLDYLINKRKLNGIFSKLCVHHCYNMDTWTLTKHKEKKQHENAMCYFEQIIAATPFKNSSTVISISSKKICE